MSKSISRFALITIVLVGFVIFFVSSHSAYASPAIGLQIDGKHIEMNVAPYINNNRVMVPVRELADLMGAKTSWDQGQQAVTVNKDGIHIVMVIGSRQAAVNSERVDLNAAPVIRGGVTMAAVRDLGESLKYKVAWDGANRLIKLERPLIAGSSLDFPPFEFKDGDQAVGFDLDLIQAIGEVSGKRILIKDVSFDQLIPSLQSGEIDLIISGMSITEHRKKVVDFTDPYFDYGEIIVVPRGSRADIGLEDLAGKTIAVQVGTHAHEMLIGLQKNYPATTIMASEQLQDSWAAVEESKADAALVPHPFIAYYLKDKSDSKVQMTGDVFVSDHSGIVIAKDNPELLETLNRSLETLKKDGIYDRIYQKWFGSRP